MSANLKLRTKVSSEGRVELSIVEAPTPEPGPNDVIIRVEASPLNPSDLAVLLAGADLESAHFSGSSERPVVTAEVPQRALLALAGRVGQSLTAGNEGSGTVISADSDPQAQQLVGRTVAVLD